ncbi:MAG: glycosyltransferase, partial [Candidatus Ratteibacteria bacterium]|nr:glycosyltransferase [Candidatus Ratteibacteria bacterium]
MRQKISAIVPTYNEEHDIEKCLRSLDWTDEIIIVDSFS